MFEKGQLVVCVDNRSVAYVGTPRRLTVGTVYTVAGLSDTNQNGQPGVFLSEVACLARNGFRAWRFRPVSASQISLVNSMLVTKKTKEPVLSGEQGDAA